MKNFVQRGDTITVEAPAAIASGDGVQVGKLFGVAATDATQDADVEIVTNGVFNLAKVNGAEFAVGDPVFWHSATNAVTDADNADSDDERVGVALASAGSSAATARVRLDGMVA